MKKLLTEFLVLFLIIFNSKLSFATNIESLTTKERSALIDKARCDYAEQKMQDGNLAMLQQDYCTASKHYYAAFESVEQNNAAFTQLRNKIIHLLCESIILLISQNNTEAALVEVNDSNHVITTILGKSYPLYCGELTTLSNQFYNKKIKTITYSKIIQSSLKQANENMIQESWENALIDYKKILALDSNNIIALLGVELIDKKQKEYTSKAKKNRNEMIDDVDASWNLPPINVTNTNQYSFTSIEAESPLSKKLQTLIIPKIDFYYISITEALKQLKAQAYLADTLELNPNKKGINIVLKANNIENSNPESNIHLSLENIPLGEVITYLAQQANLKIKIDPYAIVLSTFNEEESPQPLLIKEYKIPPNFLNITSNTKEEEQQLTNAESRSCSLEKEALLSLGITFPKGSTVHYFPESNLLITRNTLSNLNLLDSLIKNAIEHPPLQVEIETRFVEVKQNVWKEKGLNWLLGSFSIGKNVQSGGGTVGNQATYNAQDYPIQQNGTPAGTIPGGPPGAGSVTAGNRLDSTAIAVSTLETLLGGYCVPSTGILALAGVLTNPQFQVVLRALNQKKGVDLLSSPKVTVSSGKKATITVARDFPYPDEYLPPQIPQSQGGGVNPAIPATPTSFKRRNVGVELEVEPVVSSDKKKIDLKLVPQVVEFQGFVNYGNPIFSQAPVLMGVGQGMATGNTAQVLLTENTINQPIFSVRQVNTQVTLRPGQTIVLGGLIREDVQKIKDKTPIIGDIPLVGNLFRSSSEQRIKKNLLIFVTVWLIDPSGKKIKM